MNLNILNQFSGKFIIPFVKICEFIVILVNSIGNNNSINGLEWIMGMTGATVILDKLSFDMNELIEFSNIDLSR